MTSFLRSQPPLDGADLASRTKKTGSYLVIALDMSSSSSGTGT